MDGSFDLAFEKLLVDDAPNVVCRDYFREPSFLVEYHDLRREAVREMGDRLLSGSPKRRGVSDRALAGILAPGEIAKRILLEIGLQFLRCIDNRISRENRCARSRCHAAVHRP